MSQEELNNAAPRGAVAAAEKRRQVVVVPTMPQEGTGRMFGQLGGMGGIANLGGFAGRSGATRVKMLQEGGGNDRSEACVAKGLSWLARHQSADGRWSLNEFHLNAREKPLPAGK